MITSTPSTSISFLSGVPLPLDYSHTIWFSSRQQQWNYFSTYYGKRNFENCSYQRASGTVRIQLEAGEAFTYNYMYYQNPDEGNRVWYCFITDVMYINNSTVDISYQIDFLQTFLFDITFHPCYVDREHVSNDSKGAHTEPEPFGGLGQYVYECVMSPWVGDPNIPSYPSEIALFNKDSQMLCMAHSFSWEDFSASAKEPWVPSESIATLPPSVNNGIFQGLYLTLWAMDTAGITDVKNAIEAITENNKITGVLSIFQTPLGSYYQTIHGESRGEDFHVQIDTTKIGLYTPKNNKMYTYPYCFCYATNGEGNAANYKLEYFEKYQQNYGELFFSMAGQLTLNPVVALIPRNYQGILFNFNQMLTTSSFPTCSWESDVFKAYLAQNSGKLNFQETWLTASTIGKMAVGTWQTSKGIADWISGDTYKEKNAGKTKALAGAGAIIGSAINAVETVMGINANMEDISSLPPQAHGNDTSTIASTLGFKGFELYKCYVNSESAAIIDNFFSMYGYHRGVVKMPEFTSRTEWNYVKTVGMLVTGNAPSTVLATIGNIFNNGITLWHNPAHVGDYTRDNPIRTGA